MLQVNFEGKGIVVIGRPSGVDGAVALMAARRGARVAFCGRQGSEEAEVIAAARLAGAAEQICFVPTNLASEADIEHLFDQASGWLPGFHVLINHVEYPAALDGKSLVETSLADWNRALAAGLREPFLLSRRAVEEFLAGGEGGRIVHITSAAADELTCQASRAASQAALHSFIRSVAKEYGRRGIACNAVSMQSDLETEGVSAASLASGADSPDKRGPDRLPPHRLPDQLEAAAETVLFLASGEASYVNGEVLYVA